MKGNKGGGGWYGGGGKQAPNFMPAPRMCGGKKGPAQWNSGPQQWNSTPQSFKGGPSGSLPAPPRMPSAGGAKSRPPPSMPFFGTPGLAPPSMGPGGVPCPPPSGLAPCSSLLPAPPQGGAKSRPPPNMPSFGTPGLAPPTMGPCGVPCPPPSTLALPGSGLLPAPPQEKGHRLVLLLTRLSPEAEEDHVYQLLEQCGEVQIFRRGRGPSGQPLSFGIVQYGDPEAAWKASVCINKLSICGQEVKVLVEEQAELAIKQWRERQKSILKLHSDDELEFELERKTVSCKVFLDAKFEELYGSAPVIEDGGQASHSSAERRKELQEREVARVSKAQKRKAWREAEYATAVELVRAEEKRRRLDEGDVEDLKDVKEEDEADKTALDLKLDGVEESQMASPFAVIDTHEITRMVDRVQAEPYEKLFALSLDVSFLREEKILETKLRPWLDRKVDLYMGGKQSDLVEHTLRRISTSTPADAITSELARYMEDNADPLVERMWRMLVFELVRAGRLELEPREERRNGWDG